jgi:hypothetical protein
MSQNFSRDLPVTPGVGALTRAESYTPLPEDWLIGCCDIVDSTGLIAAGRYKLVNMVGASVITTLSNEVSEGPFPFIFGGDGASFALPAHLEEAATAALARLCRWVGDEFAIPLRAAVLPVAEAREAGFDVRIARHAASDTADYAMFSGGGLTWAEHQMKAGRFLISPSPEPAVPDLTGLSCRWNSIPARNGSIISLVVAPVRGEGEAGFARVAGDILALTGGLAREGHPLAPEHLEFSYPPNGMDLEAHASRKGRPLWLEKLRLLIYTAISGSLFWYGRPVGGFDPRHYRRTMCANTDFRKLDDGLKMTLDCTPEVKAKLQALLQEAAAAGHIQYGLHEQAEATVTCIVPAALQDDHIHFVDGAAGGYAAAAAQLKSAQRQNMVA